MIVTWDALHGFQLQKQELQCWRGDPTSPINSTVTALTVIANGS